MVDPDWTPGPDGTHVVVEEHELAPPVRRRPTLWPWLLALLLLVLGGLAAVFLLSRDDGESRPGPTTVVERAEVPVLVGMREDAARERAEAAGFNVETRRRAGDEEAGVVLAQEPEPRTELEEGATVRLVVSAGAARADVPDVVGQRRDDAVAALEQAGFRARASESFSDEPAGSVVEQQPAAGQKLQKGRVVALTVSKGPRPEQAQPVAVPDVVGSRSSDAVASLREAGLRATLVTVPSEEAAGTVVAQSPTAGAELEEGGSVRLNVSAGPTEDGDEPTETQTQPPPTAQPAVVPDAVGGALADAARAFAQQGLKVSVQPVPSEEQQGRVVAQAQPAGTELERGATVQVNVSMGPEPAPSASVPSVTGRQQADARSRLAAAGFEILSIRQTGSGAQAGVVLSQTPDGGASIPRGSLVILYVAA